MATTDKLSVYLTGLNRHGYPYQADDGTLLLSLAERLPFIERDDTTYHTCSGGEYLIDLAILYYRAAFQRPEDMAQVIAEFQPEPILDESVPLRDAQVILIPSLEYYSEVAMGSSLTQTPEM